MLTQSVYSLSELIQRYQSDSLLKSTLKAVKNEDRKRISDFIKTSPAFEYIILFHLYSMV